MTLSFRLLVVFCLSSIMACSHTGSRSDSADRGVAADPVQTPPPAAPVEQGPVWVVHPCGSISGMPFRKYQAFKIEEGVIWARAKETSEPKALQDKPRGGGVWGSVAQFFDEKGITKACAGVAGQNPPPAPGGNSGNSGNSGNNNGEGRDMPDDSGPFQAPVQMDTARYYASLNQGPETGPNGAKLSLHQRMHAFLSKPHLQVENADDIVVDNCPTQRSGGRVCVKQAVHGYVKARQNIFGGLDLRKSADGKYEIFDHYCRTWMDGDAIAKVYKERMKKDMPDSARPGPLVIPPHEAINTEHSWPRSKFGFKEGHSSWDIRNTDYHHMFATDNKVNGIRSNYDFAEVQEDGVQRMACADGRFGKAIPIEGTTGQGDFQFEPPREFKGDIARALMYFSVRYNAGMSTQQEAYFRKWNQEDPPDQAEIKRNNEIYMIQGLRNPFVDSPDYVEKVKRFCRTPAEDGSTQNQFNCQ